VHGIEDAFRDLALLAMLSVAVTLVLRKLRLPPVAGLLVVGAFAGPHGLRMVEDTERISVLAEVGVVLLLFTLGLEFSISRLRAIAKTVLLGGTLQVLLTIGVTAGTAIAFGIAPNVAVTIGFIFSLSSTAIVLKSLGERQETDAPHGRFIIGVLIFQDMAVIAMILLIPVLAGTGGGSTSHALFIALGKAIGVLAGALLLARKVLPRALHYVEATRSREVFGLALVALCLGTAWVTSALGLSLALGAFLAGVILADTDYAHRALDDTIPMRDVLTSLFFISMGMMFNTEEIARHPGLVGLLFLAFVLGKGVIASLAAIGMRFPARAAWLAGASLAQFGEFGFVLAEEAIRNGILTPAQLEPLLSAGLLSMFVTRIIITLAPRFSAGETLLRPLEQLLRVEGIAEAGPEHRKMRDHVVIVGYGPGGQHLANRLDETKTPYVVLELNAQTVRRVRATGLPIYYADITSREARHHAGVEHAKAVVLQISDTDALLRAVDAMRRDDVKAPIFVRARRDRDEAELNRRGVECVVNEEMSASTRLTDEVMRHLQLDSSSSEPRT